MALPTYKASGTFTAGTGALTPPYPTGGSAPVSGDIAILVVESENQVISLTTANGFAELGAQANKAAGSAGVTPANRIAVYWKRCAGGDSAPVVAAPGNHGTAQIHLFAGCIASGNPWDVYAEGNDGGVDDLTGVIPGATTTVVDCLVVLINGTSWNGTSTAEFTGWANGDLGSVTERTDNSNTSGLGGGHGMATGTKAGIGTYGNTTVALAHTCYKGAMSIALKPPSVVIEYGAATLSGAGTLAGIATRARSALATLVGAGTLVAAGNRLRTAAGGLVGAGSIAATAVRIAAATALATGTGTLAAVGARVATAAAILVGAGQVTVHGIRVRVSTAVLTGAGLVTATGNRLRIGAAVLTGTGAVVAIGSRVRTSAATVAGAGTVTVSGVRLRTGRAAVVGLGLMTTSSARVRFSGGTVAGTATLTAAGQVIEGGAIEYGSATAFGVGMLRAIGHVLETGGPSLVEGELRGLTLALLRWN